MVTIEKVHAYAKAITPSYVKVSKIDTSAGMPAFDIFIPKVKNINKVKGDITVTIADDYGVIGFVEETNTNFDVNDLKDLRDELAEYINIKDLKETIIPRNK